MRGHVSCPAESLHVGRLLPNFNPLHTAMAQGAVHLCKSGPHPLLSGFTFRSLFSDRVLDFGDGRLLERFGPVCLIGGVPRPNQCGRPLPRFGLRLTPVLNALRANRAGWPPAR